MASTRRRGSATGHPSSGSGAGPGALLEILRASNGLTTRELIDRSGLARATVESRLARLVAAGFVTRGVQDRRTGRPPRLFSFNESGAVVVAVDVAVNRTSVALANLSGEILATADSDIEVGAGPGLVLGDVASRLRHLLSREHFDPTLVMGVAIGVPSTVDLSGEMARPPASDMPGLRTQWANVRIAREVRAFLPALGMRSIPVVVDNRANCLALGVWRTSWPEARDLVVVSLDMSLACGIISNGGILRGAHGMAGDLAHIPDASSPVRCVCGQKGCASALASGQGIVRLLGERHVDVHAIGDILRLADAGDEQVIELLKSGARRLGIVVGSAISTLDPELVVLGGALVEGLPWMAEEIRQVALARVHPLVSAGTGVLGTPIDPAVGLVGAARLALAEALDPVQVDSVLDQGIVLPFSSGGRSRTG